MTRPPEVAEGGLGAVAHPRRRWWHRYNQTVVLFAGPLILIVIGASLLPAGLGFRRQTEPVAGWPQTTGRVASFSVNTTASKTPTYLIVIKFRAAGHLVTFSPPLLAIRPAVGAPVRVSYNPHDPADAHDLSTGSAWESHIYTPIGFVVAGVMCMAFLYWLLFVRTKLALRPMASASFSAPRHARR